MTLAYVAAAVGVLLCGYLLFLSPRSQVLGRYPYHGPGQQRVVAITFDDGPNEPYTSRIADILSTMDVKATFFQVGTCVERFPAVTGRLQADGHVIGNHSLTHRFRTYLVPRRYEREVQATQRLLQGRLGRTPGLVRSPWLWRQPLLLRMLRRAHLQPVAGVFCHPLEVFQPDAARMARRAIAKTRPGSILIFHDGFDGRVGDRAETVRAVQITIEALLAKGYRFVTVDQLLGVPAYQD